MSASWKAAGWNAGFRPHSFMTVFQMETSSWETKGDCASGAAEGKLAVDSLGEY